MRGELALDTDERESECWLDAFGHGNVVDRTGEVGGDAMLLGVGQDLAHPVHLDAGELELPVTGFQGALHVCELRAKLRIGDDAVRSRDARGAGKKCDPGDRADLQRRAERAPGKPDQAACGTERPTFPLAERRAVVAIVIATVLPAPEAPGHHTDSPVSTDQSPLRPPLLLLT